MALLEVTLAGGVAIRATSVHAEQMYAHMYEGRPTAQTNDRLLDGVPERMRRIFNGDFPVHVVPPARRQEEEVGYGGRRRVREVLPRFEFAAEFYDAGMNHGLVIVWYQDEAEPMLDEDNRRRIEALAWNTLAEEFSP